MLQWKIRHEEAIGGSRLSIGGCSHSCVVRYKNARITQKVALQLKTRVIALEIKQYFFSQ